MAFSEGSEDKKRTEKKKNHQRIHRLCLEENKSTSVVFL